MKWVVAAGLACGCLISPVVPFGAGKSPTEAQHEGVTKLMPPQLAVDGTWAGDVHTAKIRVWADDDYRAQNVHWEQTFGATLEYANALLSSTFGVRLVAEYHAWSRHAPSVTLAEDLDALVREDPGEGAFAVIGLTSSIALVTATFDQLGIARLPGRHLVVRGYAGVEEHAMIERRFHDLRPDERESLLEARRLHQTTTVFLHELGHNFGAQHETDDQTIMSAIYSDHAASFTDQSRQLILATLDARFARAPVAIVAPSRTQDVRHHLAVIVTAAGETVIDGTTLDDAGVDAVFRERFARDHETEVVIRAARSAPHDAVIRLLDRAKAAGLHRMSLAAGDGP